MSVRRVLTVTSSVAVVLAGAVVATSPAAGAAPFCRPSISVLSLPAGAVSGRIVDAAPGIAVGTTTNAQGVVRAARWLLINRHWVVRPIPGVAALGATSSSATGVNRHGAITVNVTDPVSGARAYVAAGGVLYPLSDGTGHGRASADGIADSGLVGGDAVMAPYYLQMPVRWSSWTSPPTKVQGFDTGWSSGAWAVDEAGDVLAMVNRGSHFPGYNARADINGDPYGFGTGEPAVPGQPSSVWPNDLNAAGLTVGWATLSSGSSAMVWNRGVPAPLPHLADAALFGTAAAYAVSESGTVVGFEGSYLDDSRSRYAAHPLYWTDTGGLRVLPSPTGNWADSASASAVDSADSVYGSSVVTAGGPSRPTVWACAAHQAFVPTATGVPASAAKPDVVLEQG